MIVITKLNGLELVEFKGKLKDTLLHCQSQYSEKGLMLRDGIGKTYLFKYSKIFSKVVGYLEHHFEHEPTNGTAYVHWTNVDSTAAEESRFVYRSYSKERTIFKMNGYPFKRENITMLNDEMLKDINLQEFIENFVDEVIEHKQKEVKKTKVWLAPQDGSLSSVEQEMLRETKNKKQNKKGNKMTNKLTQVAGNVVDVNKDALKLAAKLEVGKVATAQLKKVVKPKLPMMVRGYADSPLFDIVLANAVGVALREYASNNEKAQIVAEAMIQSAAVEMVSSFNINDMINEMLETIDISKIVGDSKEA